MTTGAEHNPAYRSDLIESFVRSIFTAAGATGENAGVVARHLVLASLSGVDTHGIVFVPRYLDYIKAGNLDPRARPTTDHETPASVRVRGHWGFGHVAGERATELGIAKAQATGSSMVAIVESGHIGRVGHYVELAAQAGVVAMIFSGGYGFETPAAVPFGGRRPILHTNPIAFAFPGGALPGPAFDFATTAVSGMKIAEARRVGKRLPPASIVDRDGVPSDDPEDFFSGGSHVPFGGHKGYGLMVQAEWLGRIATGADDFADTSPAEAVMRHSGTLAAFFRADLFSAASSVAQRSDEMALRIRECEPARGYDRVRLPGDPERTHLANRGTSGIPIDEETMAALRSCANELNVPVPQDLRSPQPAVEG